MTFKHVPVRSAQIVGWGCGDVDDEKQVQWHTPSVPLINSHPILPQMQYSKQGPSSRANLLQWPLQFPPKKAWRWADFLQKFCIKIPIRITSLFQKGYNLKLQTKDYRCRLFCQGYIWSRGCWWKLGFWIVLVENFRIRKDKSIFGDGLCLGGTVFCPFRGKRVIIWKLIVNAKNARLGPIAGGWQLFGHYHSSSLIIILIINHHSLFIINHHSLFIINHHSSFIIHHSYSYSYSSSSSSSSSFG